MTRYAAFFATALLAGCAGSAGSPPPLAPVEAQSVTAPIGAIVSAQPKSVSPASCGARVRISAPPRGGAFQVPHCGGWSGTITYPSQALRSIWRVASSLTNRFGAPSPPSGTAVFYMEMQLLHPVGAAFHSEGVDDTVTSPGLTSSHTYTLNVYHFYYNSQCPSSQCTWTMNIGSPQPGTHSITFASPLNGAAVLSGSDFAPVWQFVQN
jgi:hypothetical protein